MPLDPPRAQRRTPRRGTPKRRATAETMATRQQDISVSEFFTKNRHLLGFDNPAKALLTTVKEAVDNSLDACEEAGILPELLVEIREMTPAGKPGEAGASSSSRFRVIVEDNGPGIVKPQIPKIFAKLLYGSKFHRLKQSRGQQGIGISAAGLYGQLTTGKPVVITSKIGKGRPAFRIELRIDTKRNQPDVVKEDTAPDWNEGAGASADTSPVAKEHGTRVEIELVAAYRGGRTRVQGVPRADGRREPPPRADVRVAQGRALLVPSSLERSAARGTGDQAAPARRRARDAPHDDAGLARQDRQAGPDRRLLPDLARHRRRDLQARQGKPPVPGRAPPRRRAREAPRLRSAR